MLGVEIYININHYWGNFNPSTDPLTQLLLSSAILLFFRIRYLVFTEKLIYIMKYPYLKVFKLWQLTSFLKVFYLL
jgi:hypothetical protein